MKVRNKAFLAGVALFALLASGVGAQPVSIGAGDSVQSVLAAQKGKRVTVRLRSGAEWTGTVQDVNAKIAVIGGLQGREFFDSVVSLDAVEAVVIRTKQ